MYGHLHLHPAWYPHSGYDYAAYGTPIIDAEFVGAPPPHTEKVVTYVPEKPFPYALVIGIGVAGVVAGYFIHTASKSGPVQRRFNRAAMRIIGDEAKRQGARAMRNVGQTAGDFFERTIRKSAAR